MGDGLFLQWCVSSLLVDDIDLAQVDSVEGDYALLLVQVDGVFKGCAQDVGTALEPFVLLVSNKVHCALHMVNLE
jgi:hypothetical protein